MHRHDEIFALHWYQEVMSEKKIYSSSQAGAKGIDSAIASTKTTLLEMVAKGHENLSGACNAPILPFAYHRENLHKLQ
jgi:hypothetical protein